MRTALAYLLVMLVICCCSTANKEIRVIQIGEIFLQAEQPYLITDSAMRPYLTFQQRINDTLTQLKFTTLTDNRWEMPRLIQQGKNWFVNWADYPVIAVNGKKNMLTHWLVRSGDGTFEYDIWIAGTTNSGTTWSKPVKLHSDSTKAEHGFVTIVPYGKNFFVCWLDGRNAVANDVHDHQGNMTLRAAVVTVKGKKLQEWELDNRVCDCCQTTAAVTTAGPVVIYRNRSDEEVRDIYITRLENGIWSKPKAVYPDEWEVYGCPVNGPRCEAMGNTLVLVWFSAANDNPQVNAIFSVDGGKTFGKPVRIDEGKPIGRVDVDPL